MAGNIFQQAVSRPINVAVGTSPVMVGGLVQGTVEIRFINTGSTTVYVLPVEGGATPSASDVTTNGQPLVAGAEWPNRYTGVQSLGGGAVTPQLWACCASGSSTLAGSEST